MSLKRELWKELNRLINAKVERIFNHAESGRGVLNLLSDPLNISQSVAALGGANYVEGKRWFPPMGSTMFFIETNGNPLAEYYLLQINGQDILLKNSCSSLGVVDSLPAEVKKRWLKRLLKELAEPSS